MTTLPSAEEVVNAMHKGHFAEHAENCVSCRLLIEEDRNAVLEAAAQDIHERGMKEAAIVVRRRKEDL